RRREAPRKRERTGARARADVEDAGRLLGQPVERGLVRRERVLEAHRVPHRRERIELPAHERTEQPPQERAAHGRVGGQSREPAPDRSTIDHDGSRWMRTSRPGLIPSIAAALPPLIATDRLRYESS